MAKKEKNKYTNRELVEFEKLFFHVIPAFQLFVWVNLDWLTIP